MPTFVAVTRIKMEEKTVQLIEQLAQKLGTTPEYVWAVLVSQAAITGLSNILNLILCVLVGYFVLKAIKKHKAAFVDSDGDLLPGFFVTCIILGPFYIIWIFTVVVSIQETITCFSNPEYWALKQVLDLLK